MLDTNGGEVLEPVVGIDKLGNFLGRYHLGQNVPLPDDALARLLDQLGLSSLGLGVGGSCRRLGGCRCGHFGFHLGADFRIVLGELGRDTEGFDFRLEFVSGRLNGHSGTVKGKGEQDILSLVTLVLGPEDRLGQRKGVANVQVTVAVRVGKGHQEGLLLRAVLVVFGISLKGLGFLPFLLDGDFVRPEGIALGGSLGGGGSHGQILHCLGGSLGRIGHGTVGSLEREAMGAAAAVVVFDVPSIVYRTVVRE
mmetsp:Transcript_15697/g.36135  ORF Transcript_15697/g.36135 Transcript_15697/m.36135 type:complete len:252 (-) Transcript_15697:12-767(-)